MACQGCCRYPSGSGIQVHVVSSSRDPPGIGQNFTLSLPLTFSVWHGDSVCSTCLHAGAQFSPPTTCELGKRDEPRGSGSGFKIDVFVAAYRVGVALPRRMHAGLVPSCSLYQPSTPVLGLCEVACTSNYVMLSIPCLDASATPLADIASRVKYAVTSMWAFWFGREDGTSWQPDAFEVAVDVVTYDR